MEANFYTQNHSTINGRNIWLYLITSPIGNQFFIQYEQKDLQIDTIYIGESTEKAEKKFDAISVKMVKGIL